MRVPRSMLGAYSTTASSRCEGHGNSRGAVGGSPLSRRGAASHPARRDAAAVVRRVLVKGQPRPWPDAVAEASSSPLTPPVPPAPPPPRTRRRQEARRRQAAAREPLGSKIEVLTRSALLRHQHRPAVVLGEQPVHRGAVVAPLALQRAQRVVRLRHSQMCSLQRLSAWMGRQASCSSRSSPCSTASASSTGSGPGSRRGSLAVGRAEVGAQQVEAV